MDAARLLSRSRVWIVLAGALAAMLPMFATAQDGEPAAAPISPHEQLLLDNGIEPTTAGVVTYLRQLQPNEQRRQYTWRLVNQLGSDDFLVRETASRELFINPQIEAEAIAAAAESPDPEVRWRARYILEHRTDQLEKLLRAIFHVVADKTLTGTVPEMLGALPYCRQRYMLLLATRALMEVTRPADRETLRAALANSDVRVRAAATAAYGILGKPVLEDLRPLLEATQDDVVVLPAARAFANQGERTCLPVFVRLLDSDDMDVRVGAVVALRHLSGKHFNYAASSAVDGRREAAEKWKQWAETEGRTVALQFPLKPFGTQTSYLNGNTLLAFGYRNKVVEYDPQGNEVWSYNVNGAWTAEKLANGNVLVSSYSTNQVQEVDAKQQVKWTFACNNPLSAVQLENGNILIAEVQGQRVVEVTHDNEKRIVWEYKQGGHCYDAHRLDNGNTLLACQQAVREVTPNGDTVWDYPIGTSHGIHPLENGNVLICDLNQSRVVEVNRQKEVVWDYAVQHPGDAFRLPNGNTLITSNNQFLEVTPDKEVVWTKAGCSYGSARR